MNSDGTFTEVTLFGETVSVGAFMDESRSSLHVTVILPKTVPKKKNTAKIFCGFYGAVATPLFTAKIK